MSAGSGMEPRMLRADPHDPELLARVARHLDDGGLLVYPTETVYGVGGAVRPEVVAALGDLKGRAPEKPFLVLLPPGGGTELQWPAAARTLAAGFWPGPLTLVLDDPEEAFPDGVRSDEGGVAVRRSPHPFLEALLSFWPHPLLSTSANPTGREAENNVEAIAREFQDRPGSERLLFLDAGPLPPSPPSSLVGFDADGEAELLREGAISEARLRAALDAPFRILFVCTGNTCRSPLAEALTRREIEARGWRGVEVRSAGVASGLGAEASEGSKAAAETAGLDLSGHRSQPLTPELIDESDLILTMSTGHLEWVERLGGEGKSAVITCFARGEEGDRPGEWEGVADPFGGEPAAYMETLTELELLIPRILDRVAPLVRP